MGGILGLSHSQASPAHPGAHQWDVGTGVTSVPKPSYTGTGLHAQLKWKITCDVRNFIRDWTETVLNLKIISERTDNRTGFGHAWTLTKYVAALGVFIPISLNFSR